jgi:hypothetical protein
MFGKTGLILLAAFWTTVAQEIGQEHLEFESTAQGQRSDPYLPPDAPGTRDAVIFEPLDQVKMSLSNYQVLSVYSFRQYITALAQTLTYTIRTVRDAEQHRLRDRKPSPGGVVQEVGIARREAKHLTEILRSLYNETVRAATQFMGALDVLKQQSGDQHTGTYGKDLKELNDHLGCASYLMGRFSSDKEYVWGGDGDATRYCGCMRVHKLEKWVWKECKEISTTFYQTHLDKHGPPRAHANNRNTRSTGATPQSVVGLGQYCAVLSERQDNSSIKEFEDLCEDIFGEPGSRHKRFLDSLILGIIGYTKFKYTDKTLNHLKKNIKILDQNTRANRKDLLTVYNMVNLTMLEMGQHRRLLHQLDEITLASQRKIHTLADTTNQHIRRAASFADQITRVMTIRNALTVFHFETGELYRYLEAITTQRTTPRMIPPPDLRVVLQHVKAGLKGNPRLSLPTDPDQDIWTYYRIMRIIPTIVQDHLVVALQIPLADISTRLNLYRVHNLPLLHPELRTSFRYKLEGKFLAVLTDESFYMIPSEEQVVLCQSTHGAWCKIAEPMYSLPHVPTCITALYQKDDEMINEHCKVSHAPQTAPDARLIKPQVWAVSSPEIVTGSVYCLTSQRPITIRPPYTVVTLPQTCGATIDNKLYLPASAALNGQLNFSAPDLYPFLGPYLEYQPLDEYRIFQGWNLTTDAEDIANHQLTDLLEYDTMTIPKLRKTLHPLDYNYPKPSKWLTGLTKAAHITVRFLTFAVPLAMVAGIIGAILYFCPACRAKALLTATSLCDKRKKIGPEVWRAIYSAAPSRATGKTKYEEPGVELQPIQTKPEAHHEPETPNAPPGEEEGLEDQTKDRLKRDILHGLYQVADLKLKTKARTNARSRSPSPAAGKVKGSLHISPREEVFL